MEKKREVTEVVSVRIGFIGAGGIATSHLKTLTRMPDVEVVALCDISMAPIERARQVIAKSRGDEAEPSASQPVAYTDYRQMLRNEKLDAVYVCLPPFAHGDPEDAVVEAGVPMLVEKPVALDLPTAARLLERVREKGLIAATGYQFRYSQMLERARQRIEGHVIGQIIVTRFGGTPATSWYHVQSRSGGSIIEMATHQVDMLRALVGEVKTVYGTGATLINNRTNPEYDIYDVNALTMIFDNGAVGSFSTNFIVDYVSHLEPWNIHIFCDDLVVSLGSNLRVSTPDGTQELPADSDLIAVEDRVFVQAVGAGDPSLIRSDYENGVRTLAVTLAADRSARTGQPVDVRELLEAEAHTL